MSILSKIFSNPAESLSIFTRNEIDEIEARIFERDGKYFLKSYSRWEEEKQVWSEKKSAPEEIVRQLYLRELLKKYKYPKERIDIEKSVRFGRETKRVDIVIYSEDNETPHLMVEVKAPHEKNDTEQLKSYLNADGTPFGVAINGRSMLILYRPYPKDFDTLADIPMFGETVDDVLSRRRMLSDLEEPKQLKEVIQGIEELVLANSGFDSFDEIFKLIYAKLHDEKESIENPERPLEFRKSPTKDANKTKADISRLFEEAKARWKGVFEKSDTIKLLPEHLSVCVGELEKFKLLGANLQVIDEAFEYLIPDVAKSKKGQYFTPRIVIDMCVRMLAPSEKERVIDTACGSGGFLIHTMEYLKKKNNWTNAKMSSYAKQSLFGIDFDEKSSKIARAMMLIAGDGKSHIYKENSLDSSSWQEATKGDIKGEDLLMEFSEYEKQQQNEKEFLFFNFDVLLANPPFAGEVKESSTLAKYKLGRHPKTGKNIDTISRHLLFIERNLNFVKPGGRLALVLPQGVFNNTSEEYVRNFIMEHARILGVVWVEGNSFKPHTGTKTSVIFLQKWDDETNPRTANYPIFFATSKVPFKDTSGDYIYRNGDSRNIENLQSDLLQIAEAFEVWGKEQKFSFLTGK